MARRFPKQLPKWEKRHDRKGRENWYRLTLNPAGTAYEPARVSRPKRFKKGDRVLDLTENSPTVRKHDGSSFKKTPISRKAANYWITQRASGQNQVSNVVKKALKSQRRLINQGENPDLVRVFWLGEDGKVRRFTVTSFIEFWTQDEYAGARERMLEAGYFTTGVANRAGDLDWEDTYLAGEQ